MNPPDGSSNEADGGEEVSGKPVVSGCDASEVLAIIQTMPQADARIFPYTTDAISSAFTTACRLLGIEDLHFHDLRHEGISRLFEMGRKIAYVAAVSGHRSWSSLKRYTHIRQAGDKYANWQWLTLVTAG